MSRRLILAGLGLVAAAATLAPSAAEAGRRCGYGWHRCGGYVYARPYPYYAPPPVVVYQRPAVVYAPPPPVVYAPPPVVYGPPMLSLGVNIPLR
jgi:hypothetical protein